MELKWYKDELLLCTAASQFELNDSLVRIQEFYESVYPEINGKVFTLAQYKKIYAKHHGGKYTYNTDWVGNNIPGHIIRQFFEVYRNEKLRPFEQRLKRELTARHNLLKSDKRFYLIAIVQNGGWTINHELAHAFFTIYPAYHKRMVAEVEQLDAGFKAVMVKYLKKDYREGVWVDEMQAYCATGDVYDICRRFKVEAKDVDWVRICGMQKFYAKYRYKLEDFIAL